MTFIVPDMNRLYQIALAAIGSLATFAPSAHPIKYPYRSDSEALRSDWLRLGMDFDAVIEREDGQKTHSTAQHSRQ